MMPKSVFTLAIIIIILGSSPNFTMATHAYQKEKMVIFVVNSPIYKAVKSNLLHYISTIKNYRAVIKTWSSHNATLLRNYLQEEYREGAVGAIFIGNIVIPRYYNYYTREYSLLPYFYMDLQGNWQVEDGLAVEKSIKSPCIWLGIVRSTDDHGNNVTQINNYLQRVIEYAKGKIKSLPEGAGFVDDDFSLLYNNVSANLNKVYPSIVYYQTETTTSEFLKNILGKNYAILHIVAHSDGYRFLIREGIRWGNITTEDIDDIHPKILFYTDISCHAADFYRGAIANHFIMHGQGLGVFSATGYVYPQDMNSYYFPLSYGADFGEAMLSYLASSLKENNGFEKYVATACFLGIPLLHPWEPVNYENHKPIYIDNNRHLIEFAKYEGLKGSGKNGDPIIISKLYIRGNEGLVLQDITLYVKIEDNYIITPDNQEAMGIELINCTNVVIEDNVIAGGSSGIEIYDSTNVSILKNHLIINGAGVAVFQGAITIGKIQTAEHGNAEHNAKYHHSKSINIKNNLIENSNNGIFLMANYFHRQYYLKNIYVDNNSIYNFTSSGIFIGSVNNSRFFNNIITGSIQFRYSTNPLETGIVLWLSSNNTFFGNIIKNVSCLMNISRSENNLLYANSFYGRYTGSGICFWSLPFVNKTWYNRWNNSHEGNYWENCANKKDKNKDGIIDSPYFIAPGNTDYKPLKNPPATRGTSYNTNTNFNMPLINAGLITAAILLAILWIYRRKKG